jgi:methyltransferase (TIGR00027 family)
MRVLMTDGSGLTARQCATRLARAGHTVEALAPDPLCLCRFTRHVRRIHRVPSYGADPFGWLEAALAVYRSGRFDLLFPTQEQVAVLSLVSDRLNSEGVVTVVPSFEALAAVQDKVSASVTLRRLGIPQPPCGTEVDGWKHFPAYVKTPIGTASGGVRRVATREELHTVVADQPMLIQGAVDGPLVMCQSVFDHGSLVAFHANRRTGEGANGGASHKTSVTLPEVRSWIEALGADLAWHGALSADVILADRGPAFIDLNPRLVEPQNAWLSGVDLVGAMLDLAAGSHPQSQPESRSGVATHQVLLGVLGAAQFGRGRRGVASELLHAWRRTGEYRESTEELTPRAHDPKTVVPVAIAATATLVAPSTWSWFSRGSVSSYALTQHAWQQILDSHQLPPNHPPRAVLDGQNRSGGAAKVAPKPTRTAELMAVQRGLESRHSPHRRLFEDPFAPSFVSPAWRLALAAARLRPLRKTVETAYDLVAGPGPRPSAIARTRLIDDEVTEVAPTVDQIVILGAGYDTRPHRLPCLSSTRVFEVDHPDTQVAKRAVFERVRAGDVERLTFVPVNFETDDLAASLLGAGFSSEQRALILWEGVTQYLSPNAVDATLAVIREVSRPQSFLILTYVDIAAIKGGTGSFPEAKRWLRGVARRGEPWIFGISPNELSKFLEDRGYRLISDLSTAQAGERYFAPLRRREHGSRLYHVATASTQEV